MNRKLALIIAAIVLPGGFIALLGAMFFKALTQTKRGRRVVALAQKQVSRLTLGPAPTAEEHVA